MVSRLAVTVALAAFWVASVVVLIAIA